MRRPTIVGNWKMNTTGDEAVALASSVAELAREHAGRTDVGVAPPALWLDRVLRARSDAPLLVYAQNASQHSSGAFTGDISCGMLVDLGVDGVIVGHSERRHVFGESDDTIGDKVRAARAAGLHVILCVGEQLDDRDAGQTWDVVRRQLETGAAGLDDATDLVIAYEPVWAIGTGRTATPEQAQDVHAQIRAWLGQRFGGAAGAATRIQYGGSVKAANATGLLGMPDIDGALVGGASLSADGFGPIVAAG